MPKPAVAEEVVDQEEAAPVADATAEEVVADEPKLGDAEFSEDAGEGEVEAEAETEVPEETAEQEVQRLREEKIRFEERERIRSEQEEKGKPKGDPWYVAPETMAQYQKDTGFTPAQLNFHIGTLRSAVTWAMAELKKEFSPLVADRSFDGAIREFAKDKRFSDATRHAKDMKEFLEDFPAERRGEPKLLEKALKYARGASMSESKRGAIRGEEVSRKLARSAEPASTRGAGGKVRQGAKGAKPTDLEVSYFNRFGKAAGFKTIQEYMEYGKK